MFARSLWLVRWLRRSGDVVHEYSLHPNWGLLGIDEAFWVAFVPAATMFIIRGRLFSYCFLFLYIAVTIQMFFEVRAFNLGYKPVASDIPLGLMAPFYVLSLACLVAYPVISLIRIVVLGIKAEMDHPSS
jgi:hypothetical protein